jgi:hypothetical protein
MISWKVMLGHSGSGRFPSARKMSYSPTSWLARMRVHARFASSAAWWAVWCHGFCLPSGPGSGTGQRKSAPPRLSIV